MGGFPTETERERDFDIDLDRVVVDPDYRRRVIDRLRRDRLRSAAGRPAATAVSPALTAFPDKD